MDATTTTPSWDRTRRDANTDSAPSTRGVRGKRNKHTRMLMYWSLQCVRLDKLQGCLPCKDEETRTILYTNPWDKDKWTAEAGALQVT